MTMSILLLRILSGVMVLVLAAARPMAEPARPEPPAPAPLPSDGVISTADDLLLALERAGSDIRTLTAPIRYVRIFAIEGDEQVRTGTLYYVVDDPGDGDRPAHRRFAVHFTTVEFDGRIDDNDPRSYIFDGEWLVERSSKTRQFIKRQVVPAGERFDPLRIGEGPFPIPIGQRRDEIIERFHAELLDPMDGISAIDPRLEPWLASRQTYQLRLVPRAQFEHDFELREVRLWYLADTLLPRVAWSISHDGNESVVQLLRSTVNEPVPADMIDTTTPGAGWDVEITPYRRAREGG